MQTSEQRRLLGRFIRAHRERIRPDTPAGRRRTPGLRREELADRAGIGATWCAWIEQGRDISVSSHTLARLAVALDLTRAERAYMFELAGRRDPHEPADAIADDAPASIRTLTGMLSQPAYGLDRAWNACSWNAAAEDLFAGWLGEGRPKNLLRFVFTESSARDLLPDWEDRARRLLAEFRADYGRRHQDPATKVLVDQLHRESRAFADAWSMQAVAEREGGLRGFNHPDRGLVHFRQWTFNPADRPDYKLVVLHPAGAADQLAESPSTSGRKAVSKPIAGRKAQMP